MKNIAVVATVWFPLSHADVIVTRWVNPFPTDAECGWSKPQSVIASAYIEQRPVNDIGAQFCAKNNIPLFENVEEALTLGTGQLAVDGVLLIGEHGDYPRNEFGQKLYPRKRLFDAITDVFRASKRSVPVFNDKHFSWDFSESCEMMETARALAFPLYGGSSLAHCPCDPPLPFEEGEEIREVVALFSGGPDDYGFHSMEYIQAFVEKGRRETGVRAVRSLEGKAAREAVDSGEVPRDLLLGALTRHGYPARPDIIPFIMERTEGMVLFQIEHLDGLRVTHLLLPKFVSGWVAAIRLGTGRVCSFQIDAGKGGADFFQNFAFLNVQLESLFQNRQAPTPPERTHLVTGTLQAALQALKGDGASGCWVETPHLGVTY